MTDTNQNTPDPAEGVVEQTDIAPSGQPAEGNVVARDHRNPLLLTPAERQRDREARKTADDEAEKRSKAAKKAAETRRRNSGDN